MKSAGKADSRTFDSNYFLSRGQTNKFQYEVKRRTKATHKARSKGQANASDEDEEENDVVDSPWIVVDEPGEVPDGDEKPTSCADHWKASAEEQNQRSLAVYENTGIFPLACRHGLILKATEMVESGEL